MDQMLNEIEVSEKLCVATQTLRNWRHLGKGPSYIKMGYAVRYSLSDLLQYIESKKIIPGKDHLTVITCATQLEQR